MPLATSSIFEQLGRKSRLSVPGKEMENTMEQFQYEIFFNLLMCIILFCLLNYESTSAFINANGK